MKRGTPDLTKTKRLARRLRLPIYSVVGLLELLWHWTPKNAPQGDVGRFENADIADGMGWDGDPDVLIAALVAEGWLDISADHRLVVHDVEEHADQDWKRKLERRGLPFLSGTPRRHLGAAEAAPSIARARVRGSGSGSGSGAVSSGSDARAREANDGPVARLYRSGWGAGMPAVLMAEAVAEGRVVFGPDVEALFRIGGCDHPREDFDRWVLNRRTKGLRSADWLADLEAWAGNHKAIPCPACVVQRRDGVVTASGMRLSSKTARTLAAAKRFAERERA